MTPSPWRRSRIQRVGSGAAECSIARMHGLANVTIDRVCTMALLAASAGFISSYISYSLEKEHHQHEEQEMAAMRRAGGSEGTTLGGQRH
mmetsp:Transcript_24270/g.72367  ORF Transcript_24270/g.72367 Transcript_24270/m.72367 type:complete len:90 (-) Transcript_24270:61-330(-)